MGRLLVLGGVVALFDSLLLAYIFALFGLPIETRTGLMIDMSFSIHPNLARTRSAGGDWGRCWRGLLAEDTA
jgi:hypothetical protein